VAPAAEQMKCYKHTVLTRSLARPQSNKAMPQAATQCGFAIAADRVIIKICIFNPLKLHELTQNVQQKLLTPAAKLSWLQFDEWTTVESFYKNYLITLPHKIGQQSFKNTIFVIIVNQEHQNNGIT
jgi:hypothetical protein